ncbi:MAG: sugar porter family MFS transporter [Thermoguttaceae bacterium]
MNEDRGSFLYLFLACGVAALGGLLFGFDTAVISGAEGMLKTQFHLSTGMHGWIVSSALVGCLFGSAIAGSLSDLFGRKKVLLLAAVMFAICAVGSAAPQTPWHLVVARIIGGTGIGIASMLSPMYIAEISPSRLRGGLITLSQLAITGGILAAYLSNDALTQLAHAYPGFYPLGTLHWIFVEEVWRGMLLVGVLPSLVLFVLLFFVPESPRWLVKQGRTDEALAILSRVGGRGEAARELSEIQQALGQETGSIAELFQPRLRRALAVGILLPFFSQICGINVLIYYGITVLKSAGMTEEQAMHWQILWGVMNFAATVLAIFTVDKFGRKPLLLTGIIGVGVGLATGGWLFCHPPVNPKEVFAVFAFFLACFNFSFGSICWIIVAEIFPTAVRGRAMSISIFSLWTGCTLIGQTVPFLRDTLGLANCFWLYAATTPLAFLFVLLFVPETKGKTLEQIEKSWTR